jgi:5-amino-6-(5-phosphoribosylamino)uracil reductase
VTSRDTSAFRAFARSKAEAAESATLETFRTVVDNSSAFPLEAVRCAFTELLLGGPFLQSPVSAGPRPAVGLVFVQSRDGNTEADDPAMLGGGQTDKHVIYEGLTRVAADAVMAGATTVGDGGRIFSVWHPALIALRGGLGKPRHPVQIVLTAKGELPIEDGLLFNVPEIPVMVLSAGPPAARLAERVGSRPWITVLSTGEQSDLRRGAERLRRDFGIERVSAVGGRSAATALLDAGLVSDVYVTTSPISAGSPDTPMYTGSHPPQRDLVVRRQSSQGVVFEHFVLRSY